MNLEALEEELTALFAEVDTPPSVATWRDRLATPAADLDAAPVVRPLPFEPRLRRPVAALQRVAAAWVAVLAIGFAVVGVVTSDRVLPPPPRPDITESITDGPTSRSSAPATPPLTSADGSATGRPPASGQPAGGGRPSAQGQQPPATPGEQPVAPARGPLADWPDAVNAGVPPDTALSNQLGDLHVTTPGQIVHDVRVDGRIYVEAPDVTLRRVLVVAPDGPDPAVWQHATGLRIEDSEISSTSAGTAVRQDAAGLTVQRSDLHTRDTAVALTGGDVTIVDSFLHSLGTGVLCGGNVSGITLRHNVLTGSVSLTDENGPMVDVLLDGNQLGLDHGVAVYAPSGPGSQGFRVLGNQFRDPRSVTPVSGWDGQAPGNAWTGNVWLGTIDPVNP